MRVCYLDAFSGISGDMLVGALADAGADPRALAEALSSLGTGAAFEFEKTKRLGIGATKFRVTGGETKAHRHLPHILKIVDASALPDKVKQDASAVFRRLGEAEAAVHNVPLEKVHFHEVGAVDSIADIVGACLGFHLLGVEEISCSPINVGSGTVETEHGILPVPAPATAALLRGKPVYARGPETELTTPTGAAVAVTLAAGFGVMPPLRISAIGYGAGDKDFPGHANVLRVMLGERTGATEATTVSVIEANIDDATPEILAYATERLMEMGALDVTLSPIFMKKGRPGNLLRVIARSVDQESLVRTVFAETTTLGLRVYPAERRVLERRIIEVQTRHGKIRVKVSENGTAAPEYEDCRRVARETGLPLQQVFSEALQAYIKSSQ